MASERVGKRPAKGILKHTSSMDKSSRSHEVEWDEMNILATYHPPGKEYGHMKIDEPPTPYNKYSDDEELGERKGSVGAVNIAGLDPSQLASRLKDQQGKSKSAAKVDSGDEYEPESPEEEAHRHDFELKRKMHYNEFAAVQLAKKLMAEEDEDDDDTKAKAKANAGPSKGKSDASPDSKESPVDSKDVTMASDSV